MFFSFLKSRHGTFPFICCIKKKAFTFPLWPWANFSSWNSYSDESQGWRLFVFLLVFIPVSSCKETLGPRLSPTSQVDQLQPFVSELRKALAQARANTVLDAMRCGEMMGNWWTDGVILWGDFQQKRMIFGRCFWWTWWKLNLKNMRKNPSELPGFHWGGFVLCESTILAAPKQGVSVGCLFGTGMKLFNSIESQNFSSSWHGEYPPVN